MGLFSKRREVFCPICGESLGDDRLALSQNAHLLIHLEDRPGERLALPCGHADAEWSIKENFPVLAAEHVWEEHRA